MELINKYQVNDFDLIKEYIINTTFKLDRSY